jgi:starch synthase
VFGKPKCKESLQVEHRLPVRPEVPLYCMVTRLDNQKGLDLVAEVAEEFLSGDVQWVVLGTGIPKYHELFMDLARRFPAKLGLNLRFDEGLARRIYAGSDLLLMPSRYEPCGLNQLIAMKYGTVPVVRATGGLADTVVDYSPESLDAGKATGFAFTEYSRAALLGCIRRSLELWPERDVWRRLIRHGMGQDWSWNRSAVEYLKLYDRVRAKRAEPLCV